MAEPTFYNQGDQAIYNSGMSYVPQEKYRLGYTAPTVNEQKIAQTFGIPNTNAFTNSGGGFNQSGNAFGYGSPVEEVNVRTFNPQPYNPTGGSPFSPSFDPMANKESYGAQGQYTSPYDDTVDLGFRGRDTSTSIQRNRGKLGKAFDFVTDFIPGIGTIKRGAKFIKGMLPDNPNGPGGGTYGVAGLSDAQKEAYNTLARGGMLFSGSSGMKTSTGKNFTGKGYEQGQLDIYDKEFAGLTDDEKAELADINNKAFKARKFRESTVINNFRQNKIAAADKSYKEQQEKDAITAAANPNNPNGKPAAYNYAGRDNEHGTHTSTMSNEQAQSNQDAGRTGQYKADGGRVGYFFGGRVNFKDGGLASIL